MKTIEEMTKEWDELIAANRSMADDLVQRHDRCCELAEALRALVKERDELKEEKSRLEDEIGYQSQWKTEFREQLEYAKKQLAAAQAVIAKLREALDGMKPLAEYGRVGTRDVDQAEFQRKLEVLSTPSDDTALRQLLEAQREASAKLVNRFVSGDGELNEVLVHDIEEAISAMPLVIDKD